MLRARRLLSPPGRCGTAAAVEENVVGDLEHPPAPPTGLLMLNRHHWSAGTRPRQIMRVAPRLVSRCCAPRSSSDAHPRLSSFVLPPNNRGRRGSRQAAPAATRFSFVQLGEAARNRDIVALPRL